MSIEEFYAFIEGPAPQDAAGRQLHEMANNMRHINGCDLWTDPIGSCLGSWSGWSG